MPSAHSYTPSDARATCTLCCDDVNAERAPLVRGVHEGLWIMLGVQVAHFRPMCLTARNSPPARATLRVLLIMSRTAPTSEVRRVGGPRGAGGPPARATADPPLGGTRTC